MVQALSRFFNFSSLGTNFRTEVLAGITTFLTMAYIIIVNPLILSNAGMPIDGVLFATVMVAGISSILMGVFAKLPIALAPGMGLNAFFTYGLVIGMGLSWQTALAAVFLSGILFMVISLPGINLREKIVKAVPVSLRMGVAAGIGLFLSLIGLINAGVIVSSPATIVAFGGFSTTFVLFLIGLIATAVFSTLRVPGSLIISILFTSFLAFLLQTFGWVENTVFVPNQLFSLPSLATFWQIDLIGLLSVSMIAPIFALLFTDMFDSISTFLGVTKAAGLVDEEGNPKNVGTALFVDGASTAISGVFGSSPGTSYIESAAGVNQGGRSGLTAVVAGLLFLPFMFISPLLGLIPAVATAPILVFVGLFMMATIKDMDWSDYENSVPAFIAMIAIPFTYNISLGISLGIVSYTLLKLFRDKFSEVSWTLLVIFALALIMLAI